MIHRDHLLELLGTNQRKLEALELQNAKYGLATPSHILIEIEDTQTEIQKLEIELDAIELDAMEGSDQGEESPSRTMSPPRPWWRSWILWLLVGIALVITVVLVVLLDSRGDDRGDGTPAPPENVSATDVPIGSTTEEMSAPNPTPISGSLIITTPIQMELFPVPLGEVQSQEGEAVGKFFISQYEVTNKQYKKFMDAKGYEAPFHWEYGRIPSDMEEHPVVNVNWKEAVAFTEWLSGEKGMDFRLPTVEEWQKACEGDNERKYPWGFVEPLLPDKPMAHFAHPGGNTVPVGSYPDDKSPYEVLDMAGNVQEWTASETERGKIEVRGGGFQNSQTKFLLCAGESAAPPDTRLHFLGFRVVVSP